MVRPKFYPLGAPCAWVKGDTEICDVQGRNAYFYRKDAFWWCKFSINGEHAWDESADDKDGAIDLAHQYEIEPTIEGDVVDAVMGDGK